MLYLINVIFQNLIELVKMVGFITGSRRDTGTPEVIIEDSSGRVPI